MESVLGLVNQAKWPAVRELGRGPVKGSGHSGQEGVGKWPRSGQGQGQDKTEPVISGIWRGWR